MGSEQPNDIGNAGGFKHRNLPTIMYIEATVTMTATDAHIVKVGSSHSMTVVYVRGRLTRRTPCNQLTF